MVNYECLVCNYKTRLRGDHTRHILTKKHNKNMEEYNEKNIKPPYTDSTNIAQMSTNIAQMSKNIA